GNNSSQAIQLYCGNGSIGSASNAAEVFDITNGFEGVWHFAEDGTGTRYDATSDGRHLSPGSYDGDEAVNSGVIGKCDSLGIGDRDTIKAPPTPTNYATLSAWVSFHTADNWSRIIHRKYNGDPYSVYYLNILADRQLEGAFTNTSLTKTEVQSGSGNLLPVDQWAHAATTYDGSRVRVYLNGVEVNDAALSGGLRTSGLSDKAFINFGDDRNWDTYTFAGKIDETRISSVARDQHWLRLCHENQKENQTLVELGGGDATSPTIASVSSSSSNGTYGIGDNINITVTFSEEVTLAGDNLSITLETGSTDRTVTIAPFGTKSTTATTTYTVQAGDESSDLAAQSPLVLGGSGTLQDTAGNDMTDFTIPSGQNINDLKNIVVDGIAPSMTQLDPTDGSSAVGVNYSPVITFDEDVAPGTGNIVIKTTVGDNVVETFDIASSGRITITNDQVEIDPTDPFDGETGYYVTIAATCIDDIAGNSYAGISSKTTWNFTTGDITDPTIQSLSPTNGATDVSRSTALEITFSEDMRKGSGTISVKYDSDDSNFETFDVATSSQVSVAGTPKATITPSTDLDPGTKYYVLVPSSTFEDLAGRTSSDLPFALRTDWAFTTACGTTAISAHPQDATVDENTTASFSIDATGTNLSYQWEQHDGSSWNDVGDDTDTYEFTAALANHGDSIRCVLVNGCSERDTSNAAYLEVNDVSAPIPATPFNVIALGSEAVQARWETPESGDTDVDSVYVFYNASQAPPANPDASGNVKVGVYAPGAGDDRVENISGLSPSTEYYFALWLTDTSGNTSARLLDTVTTLEPGAVSNPLVVRGARVDAGTVTLTVSNATLLPTDELLAYVDSIGIWYDSTDWPAEPDWSSAKKFKYSLASITGDSVFDVTVPALEPGGDSTYFFAISPYWRNVPGDSLPPFDQANGDEVMMFDTVPVPNNLVINDVSYNRTDTTISMSISGADDIDSKAESLYVWYGITNDPFSTAGPTPAPIADVSGDPYSPPPIKDASFAGDTQTIYVAVALMGENGILSAAVVDSVDVGTPRPSNTQALDASKIGSYGAALEWSDADSVRIWYGTSVVPTDADPTPATHAAYYPSSSATKDT
ncbi:MAG: hypothetical protein GF418_13305, partial [Chitinivibrionales bacterium]|nr:hypothetical protein [Chitinivibrionales bacterium]